MEAKDRIVKTTEENCHNTLDERLAEQDEISFKEGIRMAYDEWLRKGYITGYDLGKVVEYLEKEDAKTEKETKD